jgi:hypothetical protein
MLLGAIHRLVEATSEVLASPRIVIATPTWQAVEVPNRALEPGHRVPLSRPPVESTRSRVNRFALQRAASAHKGRVA